MNSKIEHQTLTTRYLGGRGRVCYVCFVGECQVQADVAHLTLLSSVKLIFFCEKGLLLGLSKGDARVEIPASFVLAFNCKIAVKSLTRMRDVLTDEYMAWCSGGRREVFAVQNQHKCYV